MANVLTSKPIRQCQYRYCPEPKNIPQSRRSDAKYCCDEHGYMERNERKNDNIVRNDIQRKLREDYNIVNKLSSRDQNEGPIIILKAMGFNFDVLTELEDIYGENDVFRYKIYEFVIEIKGKYFKIIK